MLWVACLLALSLKIARDVITTFEYIFVIGDFQPLERKYDFTSYSFATWFLLCTSHPLQQQQQQKQQQIFPSLSSMHISMWYSSPSSAVIFTLFALGVCKYISYSEILSVHK